MHTTINKMWGNLWSTSYLLTNVYTGSGKTWEHETHMDNMQMQQIDELWWMTSQMSHTKQLHKSMHN